MSGGAVVGGPDASLFEVWHPQDRAWRGVSAGYVHAFLRSGPGEAGELLARLEAGETLNFNGWRLRRRGAAAAPARATRALRRGQGTAPAPGARTPRTAAPAGRRRRRTHSSGG